MNTWIEKQKEKQNNGGISSYANNEGANKYGMELGHRHWTCDTCTPKCCAIDCDDKVSQR